MSAFVFDEFVFDDVRYSLKRAGVEVKADTQVLELLAHLLKNPNRVITKEELIDEIWQGRALGDNVISVCVAKLRKALGGASKRCIGNVYGRGYRFMLPVTRLESVPEAPPVAAPITPARPSDPLLVGRQLVMNQLEVALLNAQAGRGSFVALLGEAGIGKTRLAEALEARAPQLGFAVSWGYCNPFQDVPPLWPFLQLLRAWELQPSAATKPQREDSGEFVLEPNDDGSDRDGAEPWHKTVLFISETLAKRCARQPQLIILEDVQWAATASLKLLSHLVSTVAQLPVLFVLTVRDNQLPSEPRTRRTIDYVLGHRDCTRIALQRLLASDVDAYTHARFGAIDADLTQAVLAKSEGNPFFMVELLRPFSDGQKPQPGQLKLSGPALDIVRQALQQLTPATRDVLVAASIVGRSFDLGLLSSITGHDPDMLVELLEPAMSSHVLIAQRDSLTHFAFGHDLFRDVLCEDLSSSKRTRLHLRVAEGLLRRVSSDASELQNEIAHHLLAALPAGDAAQAIRAAHEAARAASRIGAHADACRLVRRAREALSLCSDVEPETACRLVYDQARFERAAGEPTWSRHLEQAVALAQRHRLVDILVGASLLVSGPPGTVTYANATQILEAALEALPSPERPSRAMLLAHLSWHPPYSWKSERVQELLKQATSLAEHAGNAGMRTVLRARLFYSAGPDDHARALTVVEHMRNLAAARAPRQRARWSLEPELTRVMMLVQSGDMLGAQRALDAFGAAARELRHVELMWHHERLAVIMRMNAGEFAYVHDRLIELHQRANLLELHGRKAVELVDWSQWYRHTTSRAPSAGVGPEQLRPQRTDGPTAYAVKLRFLVQFGWREEAKLELDALPPEAIADIPRSRDYIALLGHFAYAASATRSLPHAALLYDLLAPYPHLCHVALAMHCDGVVARTLGGLAQVLGRRSQAIQHYELALQDSERYGLLPQLAETRYEYAQLLSAGNAQERQHARELACEARELAQQLGMKPLTQDCDRLLGGGSSLPAIVAPATGSS